MICSPVFNRFLLICRRLTIAELPNLQNVTLISDELGKSVKLRVSTHGLRSVEHVGGLDNWLMKTSEDKLGPDARKLKRELAKKAKAAA